MASFMANLFPGGRQDKSVIESRPETPTKNNFITPAEMPAVVSAVRPAIASPLPGRSFAWASLGFSWKPE